MKPRFKVQWIDKGREAQRAPNPAYPNGIDLDFANGKPACTVNVPYPAKRIGMYVIECLACGLRVAATTAGCPDDPRSVRIPCAERREPDTVLYAKQPCPVCELKLDAASDFTGNAAVPSEGDLTLCIGCGSFLAFGPELQLRELSMLEVAELPDDVRIEMQRMRRMIENVRAKAKGVQP